MTDIFAYRVASNTIVGMDDEATRVINRIPLNGICRLGLVLPRNEKHLRKYWKLIHVVHAQQDLFATQEDLSDEIKIATGYCDMKTRADGTTWPKPRSISFAKMDQSAFDDFYAKCIRFICEHILPGVDDYNLRCEIEELL